MTVKNDGSNGAKAGGGPGADRFAALAALEQQAAAAGGAERVARQHKADRKSVV